MTWDKIGACLMGACSVLLLVYSMAVSLEHAPADKLGAAVLAVCAGACARLAITAWRGQ